MRTLYQDVRRAAAPVLARVRDRALPQSCLLCGDTGPEAICEPSCALSLPQCWRRCPPALSAGIGARPGLWPLPEAPATVAAPAGAVVICLPFDVALLAAKYGHAFAVTAGRLKMRVDRHAWPFARGDRWCRCHWHQSDRQGVAYNQALLIARELRAASLTPICIVDNNAVVRIRETDAATAELIERRRNVRGAFAATRCSRVNRCCWLMTCSPPAPR